jgi:DNA-binding XRE family transcriptional regulator
MLAVVKTPHTSIRARGQISHRLIDVLVKEYGNAVKLTSEAEDEKVNAFETQWYKEIKKNLTPGKYLKVFRENKGMTQVELGKALGGIPAQHISNMERGSRSISKKVALKLANIFDVSVEKFISV